MFNFGSPIMNNRSLFGQSTPVNQNRTGNSFLFGNTTAIPASTPFSSANLLGATTILQPSSLEATTFQKSESLVGVDKSNKNDIQTSSHTKLSNELRSEDQNFLLSSPIVRTTTAIDNKPLPTTAMTYSSSGTQPITSFSLSNSSSFFPTTTTTNALFNPAITSSTTTVPTLFSTMNQPTTSSSIDLKLFQTMLNTQPFNNELTFLARNIKPNVNLDRARLHIESDSSTIHPKKNPFLSVLTKPSVPSAMPIPLTNPLSTKSNKRKLTDSFLDDDDDGKNVFIADKGPSSINTISKINIKRPRMLDMSKIRSIVLGNNESINETSENVLGWKKFPTYDEYISSKKHDYRSFRLPKLTHKDYYTKPTIEELRSTFNEQGQCFVKQFTVGRKHYGSVTFQGLHMNLAGLDLDRLVEIDRRQVTVYPDDKDIPVEGEELNCQAIISLFGVYPIDRSIANGGEEVTDCNRLTEMNYGKYLEEMTKKFHGQFIDYDIYTGTWTFQVEHF